MWRAVSTLALVLAMTGSACSAQAQRSDEDYAAEARVRLMERIPPALGAKIVSIAANGSMERACGWLTLGNRQDSLLFRVEGEKGQIGDFVSIADTGAGTLTQRVSAEFNGELDRMDCERARALPPPPPNAAIDPVAHQRLAALWDEGGPKWAIIPAPGVKGWLGVQRRRGGGQILTPVFPSEGEVQGWIDNGGEDKAKAENAVGAAAMAALDACLAKAQGLAAKKACSAPGMDRTVQLK